MGNKNKTQAPNEKQRMAIMVLALIIVIAFLGAGIFCIVNEFISKKNGTASTGSAAVGNLEEGDNIFGEEYVVVTDENGKEVTDENGKKVTEKVLYKETTDKNGNVVKVPIDSDGNTVTDANGNEVTMSVEKPSSTNASGTTAQNGKLPTTKKHTTEKSTTAKKHSGESTTDSKYTTLPVSKDKVPSTSASGTAVTFDSQDQQAIKSMLEVPYLYRYNYENANGIPTGAANHAALWMAEREGLKTNTYASGTIVLDLFKYFGQTVVNYKTNCNSDKNKNISYIASNDTFSISNFENQTHSVSITRIESLGNNNYYKVEGTVKGCDKKKVIAIIQKNQLDMSLGFSIKALKWSK